MPYYTFQNPNDENETIDVFQHMNEDHIFIVDGIKWKRVWTIPQAAIDTSCDPYSEKDFIKATNKKDTIGSLQDRSRELSEKRKDKDGVDIVKEKFYKEYSERRKGKKHPEQKKEELKQLAKGIAKIEFD